MKLPRLTAEKIVRLIERKGFVLVRQSGSHRIYKNGDGKRFTVPFHSKQILHPKILKNVMKDAGISEDELRSA